MVGIYKITSPSGNVYIGQSWDIKKRLQRYTASQCKGQIGIHRSLVKYGRQQHSFEVVHELPDDVEQIVLDKYEQLYIECYNSAGVNLLNMTHGGASGKPTEEVLKKLRRPKSAEHAKRIAEAVKKQWDEGTKKPFEKHTEESKKKASASKMGHPTSEETRRKIGLGNKGKGANSGCFKKGNNLKFTPAQILDIRSKYKFRVYTTPMLAKEFNTGRDTIGDIINRKIYASI